MGDFRDEVQVQPDPQLDDWFAETDELDWRQPGGQTLRHERVEPARVGFDIDLPGSPAPYRRRAIAAAVLVVLVLVAILGFLVLRGGGGSSAPATTTATTPATTTTPAATTTPTKPAATAVATLTVSLPAAGKIRTGDAGSGVKRLQRALGTLGFDPGPVDGIFGPLTHAAVVRFQQAKGLAPDGVVGPITAPKLNAALAARRSAG